MSTTTRRGRIHFSASNYKHEPQEKVSLSPKKKDQEDIGINKNEKFDQPAASPLLHASGQLWKQF
jgi:hypothetical protein